MIDSNLIKEILILNSKYNYNMGLIEVQCILSNLYKGEYKHNIDNALYVFNTEKEYLQMVCPEIYEKLKKLLLLDYKKITL